jgi:leader peptidase (prepilin peptidase)/N-methyltransferase
MLLIVLMLLLGLLIGSAINAIVWRLYVGRSWVHGRSMCPECQHELAARDLVPVLSWLFLRGRCRYCRAKIHWQYPAVELATAALFGWSAAVLGAAGTTGAVLLGLWLLLLTMLIILAVYDLRWLILPDKVMLPAIGVAVVLLVGFYSIAAVTRGKAMGGGDIKLAFLMGLVLGLAGTLLALLFAFDAAALIAVVLIAAKLRSRRDLIPFGPFLVAGTVLAYLYGERIIAWYLQLNGLT